MEAELNDLVFDLYDLNASDRKLIADWCGQFSPNSESPSEDEQE